MEEEEYYQKLKERGVTAEFKKTELDKLHAMGSEDAIKQTFYRTRSKRLAGNTIPAKEEHDKAASAPGSQGSLKQQQQRAQSHQSKAVPPRSQASVKPPASNAKAQEPKS